MLIAVLGPGARSLEPRDRAALAVLVLRRGQLVTTDVLADAVWPDSLPSSWRKQVQIIVGRLRKELGPEAIETHQDAYRLSLVADATDVGLFERLTSDGRRHLADDDPQRAVVDFTRALALWRGRPALAKLRFTLG